MPVSSWTVASATRDGPREVVTSRGAEIAVIVPSIVPFEFAFSEAMPAIGRGRARGGLRRFPRRFEATSFCRPFPPARRSPSVRGEEGASSTDLTNKIETSRNAGPPQEERPSDQETDAAETHDEQFRGIRPREPSRLGKIEAVVRQQDRVTEDRGDETQQKEEPGPPINRPSSWGGSRPTRQIFVFNLRIRRLSIRLKRH